MLNTTQNKIAKFIYQKRIALGMSQREFSEHIFGDKKYQPWICKIENGQKSITVDTLGRILTALNCELDIIEY